MPTEDPDQSERETEASGPVSGKIELKTSNQQSAARASTVDLDRTMTVDSLLLKKPGAAAVESEEAPAPTLPPRYQDLGRIASGGFGEVRRALDQHLGRVVAMKILHEHISDSAHVRVRFLNEAKLTAGLEHPGIVPVHDWGSLADGRLWFTMREVRGRTLRQIIDELHAAAGPDGFAETPSGWTFRRLVDAFARVCQAVAFAHRRGVVHRDLKPDNIMVGELGEVMVMDWGLGRRLADPEEVDEGVPASGLVPGPVADLTQYGEVLGTPAYMPPEQARGEKHLHGLPSDVYSLGAILFHLLTGKKPYEGGKMSVLLQVRLGVPVVVAEAARGKAVPVELVSACQRALSPTIAERHPDAEALADEVLAWLDGVRRREQALAALALAGAAQPHIASLRAEAALALASAREHLAATRPFDPVERKLPGWDLEDSAARAVRSAALRETEWLEKVHGALSLDPDLPEAHALLADHYRERLADAELAHRDEDAARFELLLGAHDRGRHAAFFRGDGALSLATDAPAEVWLEGYVLRGRRLVAEPLRTLGPTPLRAASLQRGSYLLRLRAPGRVEVRFPVHIERDSHWDGRRPGGVDVFAVPLPREGEVGPDEVYVPAGWSWTGGDLLAMDGLARRRIWVDGFVLGRHPVTNAQYLAFLNDLVAAGREGEALAACPHLGRTLSESQGNLVYGRDAAGRFSLTEGAPGQRWKPDWPVVLVDWHGATAYARWLAQKTGLPYRLPDEIEREKAARGADGRLFPWGNHFDATWACIIDSHEGDPTRASVAAFPLDESPYGARGLAGNVRDWCANLWTREGPPVREGRLVLAPAADDDPELRSVRGGAWKSLPDLSRAAARFASRPDQRWTTTSFRVARSL